MRDTNGTDETGGDEPDDPRPRPLRAAKGILVVWVVVLTVGAAGALYRYQTSYRRFVYKHLDGTVRFVDVRPAPGQPGVRLTDPADLKQFRTWLAAATPRLPNGRDLRPARGTVTVTYGDGRTEEFRLGAADAGAVVEINWGGYVRYTEGAPLARLLYPVGPAPAPSTAASGSQP